MTPRKSATAGGTPTPKGSASRTSPPAPETAPQRKSRTQRKSGTPRKSATTRSIRIEQQVCFSLHAAARTYDALYRELLAPFGLSYPQYLVMIVLGQSGPLGVNEIGANLRLDSGTLSPLLKRLESAGIVARARDRADERRVSVSLTPAGERTLHDVGTVPLRVARASGLTLAELTSLMTVLRNTTTAVDRELEQLKATQEG